MPIRRALLLVLICTLIVPMIAAGWWTINSLSTKVDSIESSQIVEKAEAFQNAFKRHLARLRSQAADWGQWDDAYRFIDQPHDEAMRSWLLSYETYQNLNLALVAFIDAQGEPVFTGASNSHDQKVYELSNLQRRNLQQSLKDISITKAEGAAEGVLKIEDKYYAFGAVPILPTNRKGSSKGYVFLANEITPQFWESSVGIQGGQIATFPASPPVKEPQNEIQLQQDRTSTKVSLLNPGGRPILDVELSTSRPIHASLVNNKGYFFLSLVLFSILCVTSTYFLLNRAFVNPLALLETESAAIATSKDFTARVPDTGSDEISRVGKSLNTMLSSLEIAHREVEEARDEATSANQAKTSFISKVSHELRTPIFSIQGHLRMLSREKLEKKSVELTQKINDSADSLMNVVNDILDFSELTGKQVPLFFSSFSIREVLLEIAGAQAAALRANPNVSLTINVSSNIPRMVRLDERRLKQIVTHLVSNAIKFTERGTVAVTIKSANGTLHINVKDTGIGMLPEHIPTALEAFQQLEDPSNRRYDGLGLGLTLCNKLVHAMSGTIDIKSRPAEGTDVSVTLPLEVEVSEEANEAILHCIYTSEQTNNNQQGDKKFNILVAEDKQSNQEIIRGMLEEKGYNVQFVSDGFQMIDAISNMLGSTGKTNPFDIVLADLAMPGCDGFEAIRRTRILEHQAGISEKDALPIIVLTASGTTDNEHRVREAGADGFLIKPVQAEQLWQSLENVINRKKAKQMSDDDVLSAFIRGKKSTSTRV